MGRFRQHLRYGCQQNEESLPRQARSRCGSGAVSRTHELLGELIVARSVSEAMFSFLAQASGYACGTPNCTTTHHAAADGLVIRKPGFFSGTAPRRTNRPITGPKQRTTKYHPGIGQPKFPRMPLLTDLTHRCKLNPAIVLRLFARPAKPQTRVSDSLTHHGDSPPLKKPCLFWNASGNCSACFSAAC
jgi:hypothetical protein